VPAPRQCEYIERMKTSLKWSSMPSNLSISTGRVHMWAWDYACSVDDLNRYIPLLSSDECFRMQRVRFEKDRVRYGVSHAILRILLGRYLSVQPSPVPKTRFRRIQLDRSAQNDSLRYRKIRRRVRGLKLRLCEINAYDASETSNC
jgi:hypothetical protein